MNWPPGSDLGPNLAQRYHVIAGAGFSALLDHMLLLRRRPALTVPILHIAKASDPWTRYHPGEMGQWPCVLTLPGFTAKLADPSPKTFLGSTDFANASSLEWARLPVCNILHDGVTGVTRAGGGDFEIALESGRAPIQAESIDVCGGPGQAKRIAGSMVSPAALWAAYVAPVAGSLSPLIGGEDFLAHTPLPASGSTVLVYGGGPTGAWCVEVAEKAGCKTIWVARDDLRSAFLANGRNDDLAQPPLTRSDVGGRWKLDHDPVARNPNTTFLTGYELTKVDGNSGGAIDCTFVSKAGAIIQTVDQVVIAIGQNTRLAEAGSWASILQPVLPVDLTGRSHLRFDAEQRALWLETDDRKLRVMGASALTHPEARAEWQDPHSRSNYYFNSLPDQLKVDFGVGLGALSVAAANDYFAGAPMQNFNLASLRELRTLVGGAIHAEMAREWIESRRRRVNPWTLDELRHLAKMCSDRF